MSYQKIKLRRPLRGLIPFICLRFPAVEKLAHLPVSASSHRLGRIEQSVRPWRRRLVDDRV